MALLKDYKDLWMTGEELFHRPDLNPCELVNGRVVPTMPTGPGHGAIEAKLTTRLTIWAEATGRGEVEVGEVGIFIRRDPDTVRAADILFISRERDVRPRTKGYLEIAPELVVEVLSPDDRMSRIKEKLRDYFSAGVLVVWLVDPALRRVLVYRSPTEVTVLNEQQVLADEGLLPGFSVTVAELSRSSAR